MYEIIDFLFLRVFEFVDWSGDNDLETELNEDKYNEIVDNIFSIVQRRELLREEVMICRSITVLKSTLKAQKKN